MILLLILLSVLVLVLGLRLWLYRDQTKNLARQLSQMEQDSSQRLTCSFRSRDVLELCREMNRRMDAQQQAVLKAREAEQELKYTISCVSHDIRTPLAGALGYIQMMEKSKDQKKQEQYGRIIRQRLEDLETLLDELFFYTRLSGGAFELECQRLQLLPCLGDALAGFYPQFLQAGREPVLSFEEETMEVSADPQQLGRVFRNLISNALAHGKGPLFITQKGRELSFSNQVEEPDQLFPDRLFERFYQRDDARRGKHAGLGLAIAKELTLRMKGHIRAEKKGESLVITLTLPL